MYGACLVSAEGTNDFDRMESMGRRCRVASYNNNVLCMGSTHGSRYVKDTAKFQLLAVFLSLLTQLKPEGLMSDAGDLFSSQAAPISDKKLTNS